MIKALIVLGIIVVLIVVLAFAVDNNSSGKPM